MPKSLKTVNRKLADYAIRHGVFLHQYSNAEVRKIIEFLNLKVEPDLVKKLARYAGDEDIEKRIKKMRKEIEEVCKDGYATLRGRFEADMVKLGAKDTQWQASAISQALPFEAKLSTISVPMIREIIRNKPIHGELVKDWFDALPVSAARRVNQQLMLGIAEGEGISEIIRRVRGRRENQYKDGVMAIARRDAEAVVRTAVMGVSNNVRQETYAANKDVIKAVQWIATLDKRTCPACGALDGQTFPVDSRKRPPLHWNCRCSTAPVCKSWKEMGIKAKEMPEGERATMDGQVAESTTFEDWLGAQPLVVQKEILGKARAEVFRSGKLSLKDFLDDRSQVMTLAQLGKALGISL